MLILTYICFKDIRYSIHGFFTTKTTFFKINILILFTLIFISKMNDKIYCLPIIIYKNGIFKFCFSGISEIYLIVKSSCVDQYYLIDTWTLYREVRVSWYIWVKNRFNNNLDPQLIFLELFVRMLWKNST